MRIERAGFRAVERDTVHKRAGQIVGSKMNVLSELQKWYMSQCNGEWEHSYFVSIGTLDNPGWKLEIDLRHTNLETQVFNETF